MSCKALVRLLCWHFKMRLWTDTLPCQHHNFIQCWNKFPRRSIHGFLLPESGIKDDMVTRNQLASVLFSNMSPCAHYAVTINTLLYKVPAFLSLILVTASYGGILNEADD